MNEAEEKVYDRLSKMQRLVVKVGSDVLVDQDSKSIRQEKIKELCSQIEFLMDGIAAEVILVSSGAIAAGVTKGPLRAENGAASQVYAALGWHPLIAAYQAALNYRIAPILVERLMFDSLERRKSLTDCVESCLKNQILPIFNENDPVATDEIKYGDNDQLARDCAMLFKADVLLYLTKPNGVYNHGKNKVMQNNGPYEPGQRIPFITDFADVKHYVRDGNGETGAVMINEKPVYVPKGGMASKVDCCVKAANVGIIAIITSGLKSGSIISATRGQDCSIFIPPSLYK